MNPTDEEHREKIKQVNRRITAVEMKKIDAFAERLWRRNRGARFGAHDPLLPDEGVVNAHQ